MTVFCGRQAYHNWQSIEVLDGQFTDTFIHRISKRNSYLPPADHGKALRSFMCRLQQSRTSASLWVQIDFPGNVSWYIRELRSALRTSPVPFAATPPRVKRLELIDFSHRPWTDGASHRMSRPPSGERKVAVDLTPGEVACLWALVRMDVASASEVASQARVSHQTAVRALQKFIENQLADPLSVRMKETLSQEQKMWFFKTAYWKIRKKGAAAAYRSSFFPPGVVVGKEMRFRQGRRHQHTARLWPAWLKKALQDRIEIWCGWCEPRLGRVRRRPDALVWGKYEGFETLFWLEVESGAFKTDKQQRTLFWRRVNDALVYVRQFPIRIIYCLLAPSGTLVAIQDSFDLLAEDVAIIFNRWDQYGKLPEPVFGSINVSKPHDWKQ